MGLSKVKMPGLNCLTLADGEKLEKLIKAAVLQAAFAFSGRYGTEAFALKRFCC